LLYLSVDDELPRFYAGGDPGLRQHRSQPRREAEASRLEVRRLLEVILFQNTGFRRAHAMPASLGAALGERFVAGGRVYYAAPTPERLAAAPLDAIRAAKLGYRDRYEEALAETVMKL
jgi:3-methyladenine DNA glycosylase/8-oxoguanine DNA glycosylase